MCREPRADVDALAPGRGVTPGAVLVAVVDPQHREGRLGLGVVRALHVGEVQAHPGLDALLFEPGEARAVVGAAPALDDDPVGKVVGGMLRRVLQDRVDLEDDDALGTDLGRDLAQLGPELGERPGGERA